MQTYQGLPASDGIAIGPAWIYRPLTFQIPRRRIDDVEQEWQRLQKALALARKQLHELGQRAENTLGADEAAIFHAHQLFLEDIELMNMVEKAIRQEQRNAEAAVEDGFEHYAAMLLAMDNEYFRARAQDVRDVKHRLLRILLGQEDIDADSLDHPAIILAEDLTPSDTIQFPREYILGLVTARGGPTSHTAILARALGAPAAVSVPMNLDAIPANATTVLDGDTGVVIVSPTAEVLSQMREKQAWWQIRNAQAASAAHAPAVTTDGHQFEVVANVGNIEDVKQALELGAEGIGLFRTEFLYLNRSTMPTETEQTEVYRQVFELMAGRPVVVRTLDIGGDKPAPYLDVEPEPNPFLGWRAIRMIDKRPDVLLEQFRALLTAAGQTDADLRIMLPLVSRLEELIQARELLNNARQSLQAKGVALPRRFQFGIMIETPAAALLASHFAKAVDFFSIGTNDLTQYTLAVDRTNERVAHLASPYHPAVLKLIAMTIDAAHDRNKWVGLCGELAGDVKAVPLLLGLGLDEFSMAPTAIPLVKETIRRWSLHQCQEIAGNVLEFSSTEDVQAYLEEIKP